jgi:hypothetical protein
MQHLTSSINYWDNPWIGLAPGRSINWYFGGFGTKHDISPLTAIFNVTGVRPHGER